MAKQGTKGGRVACLLAAGFEDSELRVPLDRLRQAGYLVEIIGAEAGERLEGERKREIVTTDFSIDEVQVADYEGLLIPGGHSPDKLRADRRFVDFVKDFDRTGRPLAAVCHGPQLLLAAELQRGRTLTAWKTIQSDLRQAGAEVKDQAVVVDGNWITSRQPDDLQAFSSKFIEELGDLEERGGWQPAAAST
ncbi:MAG TPA: type 1 glutamine amidotransferase domain-containing protein [Polyangia bacterium]|jgi:protease I|nr:type 1 glutamine amidotransferase domain-containing protein [Polyangia bacterium]